MPFAEHRGGIARLRQRARPHPDIVVEAGAVPREAMRVALPPRQQRRAARPAERIADEAVREDRAIDRKSVVSGKSVSVRVDLGGRRIIKKKKTKITEHYKYHNTAT